MIEWSIQAAQQSKLFERVVASTDDKEIAELAVRLVAEVLY